MAYKSEGKNGRNALLKKPNVPVIALEEHDADPGAAVTERIYPGMGIR